MTLSKYNEKRNFKETPEPSGKRQTGSGKRGAENGKRQTRSGSTSAKSTVDAEKGLLRFVVQRHKASHLHYDFRLELEGVLKSWAVPKGPSMNPVDKRLAVHVEDHPFSYRTFEGVIPKGNYGAGIVEIWDQGFFYPVDGKGAPISEKEALSSLKAGGIKVFMKGKKLKGEFALVQMKGRGDDNWLLLKHHDKYAVEEDYDSEKLTPKNSPINKFLAGEDKSTPKEE